MATNTLSSITTTSLSDIPDFIVEAKALDTVNAGEETFYYFSYAPEAFGYYLTIPEIFSAANAMATFAFGAGWTSPDVNTKIELEHVRGNGKDTFGRIAWSHNVVKNVVGDAFCEVKRKDDKIINMIPISPERVRLVYGEDGMLKRYDAWNGKEWRPIKLENMLHSSNKRIGDQTHGTSQIDACKWIIKARNEAMETNKIVDRRARAIGIIEYQTDNLGKINYANEQVKQAITNGDVIGTPEGTMKVQDFPNKTTGERMSWIQYLENFFYQVFGVPRSIATSDGTSEVGGKMGNVNFEPTYAKERMDFEDDLWQQQGIKVTFEKQASLGGLVQQDQAKNSGMINIQPNDVEASMSRE